MFHISLRLFDLTTIWHLKIIFGCYQILEVFEIDAKLFVLPVIHVHNSIIECFVNLIEAFLDFSWNSGKTIQVLRLLNVV